MEHILFKNSNSVSFNRYHKENLTKLDLIYSDFGLIDDFGTAQMVDILEKSLEYLKDDGIAIFIVNDKDMHDIQDLLNETLDESNFIGSIKVNDKALDNKSSFLLKNYYHILMYAKDKNYLEQTNRVFLQQSDTVKRFLNIIDDSKKINKRNYEQIIEDAKQWVRNEKKYSLKQFQNYDRFGLFRLMDLKSKRKGGYKYNITAPKRAKPYMPINGWIVTEDLMKEYEHNKQIVYTKDNRNTPTLYLKEYLHDYVDEILHASHFTDSTQSNDNFEGMSGYHNIKVRDNEYLQFIIKSVLRGIKSPEVLDPFDSSGDLINAVIVLNDMEQNEKIKCYTRAETITKNNDIIEPRIDSLITGEWANWTSHSESKDTLTII